MISDSQRSAEIPQRFKNGGPLNLSTVEVECPWLLEGLFDPENFKGWRESIELSGVPIGAIRIEPRTGVTCEECRFRGTADSEGHDSIQGTGNSRFRGTDSEGQAILDSEVPFGDGYTLVLENS